MDSFFAIEGGYQNISRIAKAHQVAGYEFDRELGEVAVTVCGRKLKTPDYFAEVPDSSKCVKCFPKNRNSITRNTETEIFIGAGGMC